MRCSSYDADMLRLLSSLAALMVRALGAAVRVDVIGDSAIEALRARAAPFLFLVWHGRILLPIHHHRDQGVAAMVSLSRDGDLTAAVLHKLGYRSVRGSSSRGGNKAYHGMLEAVRGGCAGAIIPDGPRGPARVLKPGALYLAQQAGVPIIPLSAAARPARRLQSWDRFLLPFPFARGVIVYGEPIEVPRDLPAHQIEQKRRDLERTLCDLEQQADAAVR